MIIIAVILYTDYCKEAEDTESQPHPVQTDPAHGDPDNRIIIPQIQDETWGVFYTLRYKQSEIKLYIKVRVL